eukprot:sb/3463706/
MGWFLFSIFAFIVFYNLPTFLNFLWRQNFKKLAAGKDLTVFVVGAGFSGIGLAHTFKELGIKYHIVEKRDEVGGTWFDNHYPGVGCDVKSHLYSFSRLLNPNWSQAYSEGPEILEYLKGLAEPIRDNIKFSTTVVSATLKEDLNKWEIYLDDGSRVFADVIVSGAGLLNKPKYAKFPDVDKFRGVTFHTNRWNHDCDLKGKKVGIIGTGATAVQAIPRVAGMDVEKLVVFQRSPSWIPDRQNYHYPTWAKAMFRWCPMVMTLYRYYIFLFGELAFFMIFKLPSSTPILGKIHSFVAWLVHRQVTNHTMSVVRDPETAKKLLPDFPMGCKRITPSDSYLQAYNRENVVLETEKIERFVEGGINTVSGTQHDLDVIVYATGFDLVGSVNSFEIKGRGGRSLAEDHGSAPRGFYSMTHHLSPNFFTMGGPGTVIGHNSVVFMGECMISYILGALEEMLKRGAKSVCLKESAMLDYTNWTQTTMKNKVFEGVRFCSSWYRNEDGINWTFWPTHLISFWWNTRRFGTACNIPWCPTKSLVKR